MMFHDKTMFNISFSYINHHLDHMGPGFEDNHIRISMYGSFAGSSGILRADIEIYLWSYLEVDRTYEMFVQLQTRSDALL